MASRNGKVIFPSWLGLERSSQVWCPQAETSVHVSDGFLKPARRASFLWLAAAADGNTCLL